MTLRVNERSVSVSARARPMSPLKSYTYPYLYLLSARACACVCSSSTFLYLIDQNCMQTHTHSMQNCDGNAIRNENDSNRIMLTTFLFLNRTAYPILVDTWIPLAVDLTFFLVFSLSLSHLFHNFEIFWFFLKNFFWLFFIICKQFSIKLFHFRYSHSFFFSLILCFSISFRRNFVYLKYLLSSHGQSMCPYHSHWNPAHTHKHTRQILYKKKELNCM